MAAEKKPRKKSARETPGSPNPGTAASDEAERWLGTHYAAAHLLARASLVGTALPALLRLIGEQFRWNIVAWWQPEPDHAVLTCHNTWHKPDRALNEFVSALRGARRSPGQSLAGRVWQDQMPAWIPELSEDGAFPLAPQAEKSGLHSACAVPVALAGEFLGVIELFSREKRERNEDLLKSLSVLANQVALFMVRCRAEDAVSLSDRRYRSLCEAIPQIIWTAGPDGSVDYFNQRWVEYTGLSLEETEDWNWKNVLHPDDVHVCLERWKNSIDTGAPYEIEYRLRRGSDGAYRWHLGRAVPLHDSSTNILKWFGTCTDIDDHRRSAESSQFLADAATILSETLPYETRLANVVRLAVPRFADFCFVDLRQEDGRIQRLNTVHSKPAQAKLAHRILEQFPPREDDTFGVHHVLRTGLADFLPEVTDDLLHKMAPDATHYRLLKSLRLHSVIVVPIHARRQIFGTFTFQTVESGHRYNSNDLVLAQELGRRAGLAVDNARLLHAAQQEIAERKKAEAEIQQLNQYLEQRVIERTAQLEEKNQELESFCYTVSHDLRAPLRGMQGFAQALQEDYADHFDDAGKLYANRIVMAARRMDGMIQDLLTYSRLSRIELQLEPIQLKTVLQEALEQIKEDVAQRNAVILVPDHMPVVLAQSALLRQALTNLISNAMKFVAKGVQPRVQLRGERAQDNRVRLWVEDNGIGIDPKHHERIFKVFDRLHGVEHYSGSGIGLAIVRKAMERMNGKTGVQSTLGEGSRFWVELPAA